MTVRLLVGDCRAMLATLPDASVHACITSPPYFALRRYLDPSDPLAALEMGSEPTPEQYVANLVAVFRDVRRVLHPSGVCIVNLGDSYAGSGKGPTGHNGFQNAERRQGFIPGEGGQQGGARNRNGLMGVTGYKAKDLMQMPFKVAEALRRDGWYLRSTMVWLKRSSMPESVLDRPSNALEWLFLFSKASRYFWDAEAIRVKTGNEMSWSEYGQRTAPGATWQSGGIERYAGANKHDGAHSHPNGRAFRNTDPWFLSLDAAIADARADLARLEAMRATGGVLTDGEGLPLAVDINPQGFDGAHFAVYPAALVVPFVKAGTSERGCCPRCLAPWGRTTERAVVQSFGRGDLEIGKQRDWKRSSHTGANDNDGWHPPVTLGWAASCACDAGEPVACTVLDPFAGSGTTLLVADRLGRDAVGIELSPEYARMAQARIAGDAPLFDDMATVDMTAGDYAPLGLFGEAAS